MLLRSCVTVVAFAAIAGNVNGQSNQRRADIRGGGNGDRGKCTIEVVVDGIAEVDIRGEVATLRNLTGQPPQWRRFECTSPMPVNPVDFSFSGVDGRGRQQLIRDPRNGGSAVVRIEDKDSGAEGYTFDLTWRGGSGYPGSQDRNPGPYSPPQDRGVRDRDPRYDRGNAPADRDRPMNSRFTSDQAVRVCQDAVRRQAGERFGGADVAFRRTTMDDNPGRADWVSGTIDVRRGPREETYRFSCSVNFDTGQVRSADIEPMNGAGGRYAPGAANNAPGREAIESCQRAIEQRVRRDGNQRVEFGAMNFDNRSGRNDVIAGSANAQGGPFEFTCTMNPGSGTVRSVDIRAR